MQKIHGRKIIFIVPDDLLAKLDRISLRTKKTRAETMRWFLAYGCQTFEDYEKVGMIKLSEILNRASDAIKNEVGQRKLFADK